MKILNYLNIGLISLFCSCSNPNQTVSTTDFQLSVKEGQFIDNNNRTVILNGLNHVVKDASKGYVYEYDEELFKQFRKWGVNCVRYGIHWDGLEPIPGEINESYLTEIDKRVRWAKENDLFLILDMHQDLYGRKFDNGAPDWATLDEGLPHITGKVWSDAYLISPAVQKSFDNFWLNTPASDGMGIQDHYINVWKKLAERYKDSTSVIGFDVINEPFIGSRSQEVLMNLLQGCAACLADAHQRIISEKEIMDVWTNETKRNEVLKLLDDKIIFKKILNRASDVVGEFEEKELSNFYQKLCDSIRHTGNKKILFLEHNYFCNMGIKSTFHVPVMKDGRPDSLCAYAPHAYDLVVDTKEATNPGFKRLNTIFEQLNESAVQRNLPLLIGEWGAFYLGDHYEKPATHHIKWIQRLKAGHTYWAWWPDIENQDYFNTAISRPYPQLINGTLIRYSYDSESKVFTCEWTENNNDAPTRFYFPRISNLMNEDIQLTPESSYQIIQINNDSLARYIDIDPIHQARKFRIKL